MINAILWTGVFLLIGLPHFGVNAMWEFVGAILLGLGVAGLWIALIRKEA